MRVYILSDIINFRTLSEVFNSTFHNKLKFEDFTQIKIDEEFRFINSTHRQLYAASAKLKKIHRFINGSILEYAKFNDNVVFSYRKGVSIREAVEKHTANGYFFQTDIKNFFGSITGNVVMDVIENQLHDAPISDLHDYNDLLFSLLVINNQIPAGFSTSPILSNLCLFNFDNALEEYCLNHDLIYTRYSDDIIISGNNKDLFLGMTLLVQSLLSKYVGLTVNLNEDKTRFQKRTERVKLLGFYILDNGEVTIPSRDKKEIEILLNFYLNDLEKFDDYVQRKLFQKNKSEDKSVRDFGIASLSGRLIGINAMDKKYLLKLRGKYGNTLVDMFLRKSVK